MLQEAGVKAFMNELSCTVVFERPREEAFVRKWQVRTPTLHTRKTRLLSATAAILQVRACADLLHCHLPGQLACEGDVAHVVVMPNIGLTQLEEFVEDLIASRGRHSLQAALAVAADARRCEDSSDSD
jgi:histidine decarboxylase